MSNNLSPRIAPLAANRPLIDLKTLQKRIPDFPRLNIAYIARLTTSVGIMQHAKYTLPNFEHGYCLDDNARAAMLLTMANKVIPSPLTKQLLCTYLSYINYMHKEDGKFRNFLSMEHRFLDDEGTEDSFGRTIYALGFMLKYDDNSEFTAWTREIFLSALPNCSSLRSIRANAYCLLGLTSYLDANPDDQEIKVQIELLSDFIRKEYELASNPEWHWYEQVITYDNAVIPLSLLRSGKALDRHDLIDIAYQSSLFLDDLLFQEDYLSVIGNSTWLTQQAYQVYKKMGPSDAQMSYPNPFSSTGQQPIEIPSLILLYKELYILTQNLLFKNRMLKCFEWFFGKNNLGVTLYDPISKGCADGLDRLDKSKNQGAESTISFWCAHLYVNTLFK